MSKPDWDVLITAVDEEDGWLWFPADLVRDNKNLLALEGLRFRNCYVTSKAIETGSPNLFHALYYSAKLSHGAVLHTSDYREHE